METSQDEDEFIEIEQPFLDRNLRRVMHQRKRSASPSSVDDEDEDEHNGEPDEEVAEQDEAMRLDPPFPDADPTPQRRPPFLVRSTRSRLCRRAKQTRQRRRKGARRAAAEATSWYTHIRQQPEAEYPKTMTTKKLDTRCFQCPLCSRFSSSSVEQGREELWLHCVSIHGTQFGFKAVETEDGVFHLLVDKFRVSATRRIRRRHVPGSTTINFWRLGPPDIAEDKMAQKLPTLDKFLHTRVSLPHHQYYKDLSFDNMRMAEWLFGEEDEVNDDWRTTHTDSQLCELTDVSEKEKHFFLLWNHFMKSNPILSQIQLPKQTLVFVREHCAEFSRHGLEEQLIAHLTNMWYEGVIGRDAMLECMDLYNEFDANS